MAQYLTRQLQPSADVKLGEESLQWTSFEVSRESDKFSGDYRITLPGTVPEHDDATPLGITFKLQNQEFSLVEDARIKSASENVGGDDIVSCTLSGHTEAGALDFQTSPSKDIYFVSVDWLNDKYGQDGWMLVDGKLMTRTTSPKSYFMPGTQLVQPELPPKDADPSTYEINLGSPTHQQLAVFLARRIGAELITNVPNMTVLKAYKLDGQKSYWQAFQDLFTIWNPEFKIVRNGDRYYLQVLDVCGSSPTLQTSQNLKLPLSILSVRNYREGGNDAKIVDHVIIKGSKRKVKHSSRGLTVNSTLPVIKLATISLSEDEKVSWVSSFDAPRNAEISGEYNGGFDAPDANPVKTPKYEVQTDYYYVDRRDASKWVLVREQREKFDDENTLLSRVEIKHEYARGYKLVRSTESEHMWVQEPGKPYETFTLVSERFITQDEVIAGLNFTSKQEILKQKVLVDRIWDPSTEKEYFAGATPISEATQQKTVQKHATTRQEIIEMTTKTKTSTINRVTPQVLRQIEVEYDRIAGTTKTRSDIIANPYKTTSTTEETQYMKDFYDGPGPYHPALVVEHPDINDDIIASMIAQRVFAKYTNGRNSQKISLDVLVPLPLSAPDFTVTIPDIPYKRFNGVLYENAVVPGGAYAVKKISTKFSVSAGDLDCSQTLELGNAL